MFDRPYFLLIMALFFGGLAWLCYPKETSSTSYSELVNTPYSLDLSAEQRYIKQLSHLTHLNQELWSYQTTITERMGDLEILTHEFDFSEWKQDETTEWLQQQLDPWTKLQWFDHKTLAFVPNHDSYRKTYQNELDGVLDAYFVLQDHWQTMMVVEPSLELVLEQIIYINQWHSKWEHTLLSIRWKTLENQFNTFVFYLIQDDMDEQGEISTSHQQVLEQFTKTYPSYRLSILWLEYQTRLEEFQSHEQVIESMLDENLIL